MLLIGIYSIDPKFVSLSFLWTLNSYRCSTAWDLSQGGKLLIWLILILSHWCQYNGWVKLEGKSIQSACCLGCQCFCFIFSQTLLLYCSRDSVYECNTIYKLLILFIKESRIIVHVDISLPNNSVQFMLTFGSTEMKRLFLSILISSAILCIYSLSGYLSAYVSFLSLSFANPTACWDCWDSNDQAFECRTPQRRFQTWVFVVQSLQYAWLFWEWWCITSCMRHVLAYLVKACKDLYYSTFLCRKKWLN